MKRILSFALGLIMVLSLAACGGKTNDINNSDDPNNTPKVTMTAQEILDSLKKSLGDSYTSDIAEAEERMSGYYGLDMSRIESWAAESNANSSMNMDCAVVLKVKDGYAQDAAALLQEGFSQTCNYARMYNMDLQRVLQARLFISGNYVALLIEGQQGDWEASEEDQAKFAADEAAKVDAAWKDIFGGDPVNMITIPAEESGATPDPEEEPSPTPDPGQEPSPAPDPDQKPSPAPTPEQKPNPTPTPNQKPSPTPTPEQKPKEKTAREILDSLKKSLGSSYTSDNAEAEERISGYYGLDMSRIESWAAESNANSSMNMDCAVVLQVKDGYAQDAAALLQNSFDQMCNYARMYNMDLHRILQARLFVNGNYVALLIEGQQGDWEASEEDQAKFASDEAAKVDAAWKGIFGAAKNIIVIPEDNGGFNMGELPDEEMDGVPVGG